MDLWTEITHLTADNFDIDNKLVTLKQENEGLVKSYNELKNFSVLNEIFKIKVSDNDNVIRVAGYNLGVNPSTQKIDPL